MSARLYTDQRYGFQGLGFKVYNGKVQGFGTGSGRRSFARDLKAIGKMWN